MLTVCSVGGRCFGSLVRLLHITITVRVTVLGTIAVICPIHTTIIITHTTDTTIPLLLVFLTTGFVSSSSLDSSLSSLLLASANGGHSNDIISYRHIFHSLILDRQFCHNSAKTVKGWFGPRAFVRFWQGGWCNACIPSLDFLTKWRLIFLLTVVFTVRVTTTISSICTSNNIQYDGWALNAKWAKIRNQTAVFQWHAATKRNRSTTTIVSWAYSGIMLPFLVVVAALVLFLGATTSGSLSESLSDESSRNGKTTRMLSGFHRNKYPGV